MLQLKMPITLQHVALHVSQGFPNLGTDHIFNHMGCLALRASISLKPYSLPGWPLNLLHIIATQLRSLAADRTIFNIFKPSSSPFQVTLWLLKLSVYSSSSPGFLIYIAVASTKNDLVTLFGVNESSSHSCKTFLAGYRG